MSSIPVTKGRKPYVAPACKRLSPAEAKELLLSHGDPEDPVLQHMLKRIEEIEKHSGS